VEARARLYEKGLLAKHRLEHPVISIGNLTVGGTGKTPLVMLLAARLREEGFRPVVLSRGYRRQSSGVVVVSAGEAPLVRWEAAGDEPFQIARRVKGVAVVVGANRYEAGRVAEQQGLGNLFILDDGFQHQRLYRNVDLVTIDPVEWMAGEQLLPAGRWREPKEALLRAHAAIVQGVGTEILELPIPAFRVETVVEGIYRGDEPISVENLKGRDVTAFAGIAKPDRFFEALRGMGIAPTRSVRFRDHHVYTRTDVEGLGGEVRITTEKDALKLEGLGLDVLHLRISARLPELDQLISLIRARIA
jgi:tetraacyldisaccharide 4'-kinase